MLLTALQSFKAAAWPSNSKKKATETVGLHDGEAFDNTSVDGLVHLRGMPYLELDDLDWTSASTDAQHTAYDYPTAMVGAPVPSNLPQEIFGVSVLQGYGWQMESVSSQATRNRAAGNRYRRGMQEAFDKLRAVLLPESSSLTQTMLILHAVKCIVELQGNSQAKETNAHSLPQSVLADVELSLPQHSVVPLELVLMSSDDQNHFFWSHATQHGEPLPPQSINLDDTKLLGVQEVPQSTDYGPAQDQEVMPRVLNIPPPNSHGSDE